MSRRTRAWWRPTWAGRSRGSPRGASMPEAPMLDVRDLHVYYGEIHALKGISFRVAQGEIVALLGNNGAGKTTALKTLSGLLAPRRGDVLLDGASLVVVPPHGIVEQGITHVPEGRR